MVCYLKVFSNSKYMRVLVVEDEILLGEGICAGLKQNGYTVDWAQDGNSAESAIMLENFDAVILDIGLPGKDGISVLSSVRKKGCSVPVLILTARDAVDDRVSGLDAGADDYLTKPFELQELSARLRALVRRSSGRSSPKIVHGDIEVDPAAHTVTLEGNDVEISRREFAILSYLLENEGKVASRNQLVEALYGWDDDVDSNALEVHIHHLRKKFGNKFIRTIRGVGYMVQKQPT
jgi:two-component system response regulator QseB